MEDTAPACSPTMPSQWPSLRSLALTHITQRVCQSDATVFIAAHRHPRSSTAGGPIVEQSTGPDFFTVMTHFPHFLVSC